MDKCRCWEQPNASAIVWGRVDVTAGIGVVWVHLRHLSLQDTAMRAHSDNGAQWEGGLREGGGGGERKLSCVLHPIALLPITCEGSHYPIYFRRKQFHLSSRLLPLTFRHFSVALRYAHRLEKDWWVYWQESSRHPDKTKFWWNFWCVITFKWRILCWRWFFSAFKLVEDVFRPSIIKEIIVTFRKDSLSYYERTIGWCFNVSVLYRLN